MPTSAVCSAVRRQVNRRLEFRAGPWFGLLAPAKTPEPIIETLHRETVALLKDPVSRARFEEQGTDVVGSTPAEFRAFIESEIPKWARIIKAGKAPETLLKRMEVAGHGVPGHYHYADIPSSVWPPPVERGDYLTQEPSTTQEPTGE